LACTAPVKAPRSCPKSSLSSSDSESAAQLSRRKGPAARREPVKLLGEDLLAHPRRAQQQHRDDPLGHPRQQVVQPAHHLVVDDHLRAHPRHRPALLGRRTLYPSKTASVISSPGR
jgi:hypothetical protein